MVSMTPLNLNLQCRWQSRAWFSSVDDIVEIFAHANITAKSKPYAIILQHTNKGPRCTMGWNQGKNVSNISGHCSFKGCQTSQDTVPLKGIKHLRTLSLSRVSNISGHCPFKGCQTSQDTVPFKGVVCNKLFTNFISNHPNPCWTLDQWLKHFFKWVWILSRGAWVHRLAMCFVFLESWTFAALFWALGIVLTNTWPCPPARHHSTVVQSAFPHMLAVRRWREGSPLTEDALPPPLFLYTIDQKPFWPFLENYKKILNKF